ncbi:MAG: ring finger protein HAC1 [Gemmatales bacterium]|nr:MAG: ring finger protein HAC1 [Gemmatales bacterium]
MSLSRWITWGSPRRVLVFLAVVVSGCDAADRQPVDVWGERGVNDGQLIRPRAIAIDAENRLYIVDFTARIQVFDANGTFLNRCWTTPDYRKGRPSGLSIDRQGNLIVCDSHYCCLRIYSPDGRPLRQIGGKAGKGPGEFGYICDAIQDDEGNFYIAETGENDRITKLNEAGEFLQHWGSAGKEPGQFRRPRALAFGPEGNVYVADACNHRIQVFSRDGTLLRVWGQEGQEPGQLRYPYDLAFSPSGELYVVEYGNNRVQKFTTEGVSLGVWGKAGRAPGELANPWALAIDRRGSIFVVDTDNHRIQQIQF